MNFDGTPDWYQLWLSSQAAQTNLWTPPTFHVQQVQPLQFAPPIFHPTPIYPIYPVAPVAVPVAPTPVKTPETSPNAPEVVKEETCEPSTSAKEPEDSIDFVMGSLPISTYYPTHFMRGTQLQVANGVLKRVEDLSSDDFLRCAGESGDVIVNASVVKSIRTKPAAGSVKLVFETGVERQLVPLKCQIEHPFFALGKGWCSCNPKKTGENYGLDCLLLEENDVCVVLTRNDDEVTENAVDIVTAEREMEQFSKHAAWGEQIAELYYEHVSGRLSAPPERIRSHPPGIHRERKTSK